MRMKVLKGLLALAVTLVAVFFLGAYLLPSRVEIMRETQIDRSAAQVFAVVNDLSRFNDWSPWYPLDPEAEYRHEGPASGVGAELHWQGNEQVRAGSLRIVEAQPVERVVTEIRFGATPEAARGEYRIDAIGDAASQVRWSFALELKGPLARWFGLLMPRYIGADYDRGLASLKQLLESEPVQDFGDLEISEQEVAGVDLLTVAGDAPIDRDAAADELGLRYGELIAFAERLGLEIVGVPRTLTHGLDGDRWQFLAGLPVRVTTALPTHADIELRRSFSGPALVVDHVGPYSELPSLQRRIEAYARLQGRERAGPIEEVYLGDPGEAEAEALLTRIIYPVR